MARLLRSTDYNRQIQHDNLLQVITKDWDALYEVEQSAQEEMISYLSQRYIIEQVFTETSIFDINAIYYGKNLVEYTEDEFDMTVDYNLDDRVSYCGKIYRSISGSVISGIRPEENPSDWEYITNDKSLYYAKLNQPEWSITTNYVIGNQVWFNNIVYTALTDSIGKVPSDNTQNWLAGATYSFTNIKPTDTMYWIKGDNRNQLIVQFLIDITLYHLHSRINPRNIPELRMVRYDGMNATQNGGAIGWLKKVADGSINASLPKIIPSSGVSIEWGSEIKNINSFDENSFYQFRNRLF